MSDALAVLAIYLTLGTLLMTTCFGRVESWYARVYQANLSWTAKKRPNLPVADTQAQRRTVTELRSSMPWGSFVFVALLLVMLSATSFLLGGEIRKPAFNLMYIWLPGLATIIVFAVSCIILMAKGRRIISEMEPE